MYQHCSVLFRFFVFKHLESASDVGQFSGGRSQQVGLIGLWSSRHQTVSPQTKSPPRSRLSANQLATNHLLLVKTAFRVLRNLTLSQIRLFT